MNEKIGIKRKKRFILYFVPVLCVAFGLFAFIFSGFCAAYLVAGISYSFYILIFIWLLRKEIRRAIKERSEFLIVILIMIFALFIIYLNITTACF